MAMPSSDDGLKTTLREALGLLNTDKITAYTKNQVFAHKFGEAKLQAFYTRIQTYAADHNTTFNFDSPTGSSRDSHKLIALAGRKSPELQNMLVDLLFQGHLSEGRDISDVDFLLETASRVGLDQDEAREWLARESVGEEVDREVKKGIVERGVTAVPTFTIQGRYRVGGYQEPGVFLGVFEKVKAARDGVAAA
jgi:predicted DsbA family dithiol-disulfide isomerase